MRKVGYIIIWLQIIGATYCTAQHFRHKHLEKAAQALGIMDSIRNDTVSNTYYINKRGQQLIIRQSKGGDVEHIGIPLFNQAYKTACLSPVFDCMEFLTLCQKYHLVENQLPLSDIKFFHGSWEDLCNLGEKKSIYMETVKDKYYLIKWKEEEKTIVEVALPRNYELLSCLSRKELHNDFVTRLKDPTSANALPVDYLQARLPYYIIPKITENQNIDSLGCLIYDSQHPQESIANLMLVSKSIAPDATMILDLVLDHDKREQLQIPLCQWDALCRSDGCKPYFGHEESDNNMIKGVQIMCNAPTGYDHVLYVECAKEQLGRKDITLKGTAYLYVPSSNVKELFATPKKQQSKTKRQKKI